MNNPRVVVGGGAAITGIIEVTNLPVQAAARLLRRRQLLRQPRPDSVDEMTVSRLRMPEALVAPDLAAKHVETHCRIRAERKTTSYFRVGAVAGYLLLAETATPQ